MWYIQYMENNVNKDINSKVVYGDNRIRYRSFKTELNPTKEQISSIEDFFVAGIIAYNRFIKYNISILDEGGSIVDTKGYFDAIRSGKITEPNSKLLLSSRYRTTISKTLDVASKAMNKYVSNGGSLPKFKKRETKHISYYFSASLSGEDQIACERHRINVPEIGWIRLKEKGYLPYKQKDKILSGWIKKNCGRYFVSILVQEPYVQEKEPSGEGLGIDLNINNFATVSDGVVFNNINRTDSIRNEKKRLLKYQKRIHKFVRKKGGYLSKEKKYYGNKYKKLLHNIDSAYYRMQNIRSDYLNKCVSTVIKKNPRYIALETLNVKELVKDKRFSKDISEEQMYIFRLLLYRKSKMRNIQIRMVDKYYPSSKICHECGYYYKELSLDEREYTCPGCGRKIMRDYNASLNIRDAKKYSVWF